MEYQVKISSKVKLTENTEKVKKAINNFFPLGEAVIRESSNANISKEISIDGDEILLETLKKEIEEKNLSEIFEKVIDYDKDSQKAIFYLNKQAAFANKINFISKDLPAENEIKIEIATNNYESFLKWILEDNYSA